MSPLPPNFVAHAPLVLASSQVVGSGRLPVCFAFRLRPNNEADSGWVFWSGKETQAFIDDKTNTAVYPLLRFLEMDKTLREIIQNPIGSAWERDALGETWRELPGYLTPDGDISR